MKKFLTAAILLISNFCFSQQYEFKNLIFEGAGIRGIAYSGVASELESKGILQQVEKVGGTSAGAITALFISLGYTPEEMEKIIFETNFNKFNDGRYLFFGGLYRVTKNYGWYRGDKFNRWLEKAIANKSGNPDITFEELSKSGFKDLYITGTNLSQQKLVVFSKETYPKMKVKDAVRISMSVPLYFEAVFIDREGNVFSKQNEKQNLEVVVDGGILGNFPIQIFDSTSVVNFEVIRVPNPSTLGVRIDSNHQIEMDKTTKELAPVKISNVKEYTEAFYIIVLENLNREQLSDAGWRRLLPIKAEILILPLKSFLIPALRTFT